MADVPVDDPRMIQLLEMAAKQQATDTQRATSPAAQTTNPLHAIGQGAVEEARGFNRSMMTNVGVPLAQAGLALATGGTSLPTQALVQAGSEIAAQKAGFADESVGQVGLAAAVPFVGPAVSKLAKGGAKALGRFAAPQATRRAAAEAAVEQLGEEADVIKRVKTPRASAGAYKTAETVFEDVPTGPIRQSILVALNEIPQSADSPAARKVLTRLHDALSDPNTPYDVVMREVKGLRTQAMQMAGNKDLAGSQALRAARTKILAEMEKVSPELSAANQLFKRENSISKIEDALMAPRADMALTRLLKKDKLLGDLPEADLRIAEKAANEITKMGASMSPFSSMGRMMNVALTPLAGLIESKQGRAVMRQVFKDGTSPAKLAALLTLARGLQAQGVFDGGDR